MIFDFLRLGAIPPRTDRNRLAGTVTVDGAPAKRLVVVFDRVTMVMLAARSSGDNGVFEFYGLPQYNLRQLFVAAFDSTGDYNAEIADYVSQVTS